MNKNQKNKLNNLFIRYLIKAYLKILIPSIILSLIMVAIININRFPNNEVFLQKRIDIDAFSALIVAPIIETLIMSLLIKLFSEKFDSEVKISFAIGAISSIIHGLQNFTSLLSAGWSFYMFSMLFIEVEKTSNYWMAFRFSVFIHFLINLSAIIFLKLVKEISGA